MFIQKLTIKNLKCFADESEAMEFNVPDGKTEGSGLNIFVGENGTGKTATLEAINFLTESHFAIQNKLKIFDFHKDTSCLLYTSDAADDLLCVDLGGRRIIKKKTKITSGTCSN